jgi:hypothetical protein
MAGRTPAAHRPHTRRPPAAQPPHTRRSPAAQEGHMGTTGPARYDVFRHIL